MIFKSDIKHPKEFSTNSGRSDLVEDIEAINQSLGLILTSSRGELVGDPDFGSDLQELIFDYEGDPLRQMIKTEVVRAITENESRVQLTEDMVSVDQGDCTVKINIKYEIKYTEYEQEFTLLLNTIKSQEEG